MNEPKDYYFQLEAFCGRHPALYFTLFAHRYPFNQMKVTPQTQICIEGFPRSANSYAVVAFRLANPGVKIGHHLHVAAQLIRAAHLRIPTLLLIRPPEEAVASFMVFQKSTEADRYLRTYIHFYKALRTVRSSMVIADFKTVITDMNALIEALNTRFRTSFKRLKNPAEREPEIIEKLKKVNRQFFSGQTNKSMYPDAGRRVAKEQAKKKIIISRLFTTAHEIYLEFASGSV